MILPTNDDDSTFLDSAWGLRARGLDVPQDWNRPVTHQEVEYLLNRYPFLQIVNTDLNVALTSVNLIRSDSNWIIHDYGSAMSASPGEFLFGGGDWRVLLSEKNDFEDAVVNPGKGTVFKQSFDTAVEMVAIAKQKGWLAIYVAGGTRLMSWATWVAAQELNIDVQNFEPTEEDKKRRDRLKKTGALKATIPKLGKSF